MVNGMFLTAFMRDWKAEIVVEAAFDLLLSNLLVMVGLFFEFELVGFGSNSMRFFWGLLGLNGDCFLGNDLNPLEEHALEFSLRKSLRSILDLRSIGQGFL